MLLLMLMAVGICKCLVNPKVKSVCVIVYDLYMSQTFSLNVQFTPWLLDLFTLNPSQQPGGAY